jgi:hypothetical protein
MTYGNSNVAFSGLGSSANTTATTTTTIAIANQFIIQGFNASTDPANVASVVSLYPSQGATYWVINMTVRGSGAGTSATYTIYYYYIS